MSLLTGHEIIIVVEKTTSSLPRLAGNETGLLGLTHVVVFTDVICSTLAVRVR